MKSSEGMGSKAYCPCCFQKGEAYTGRIVAKDMRGCCMQGKAPKDDHRPQYAQEIAFFYHFRDEKVGIYTDRLSFEVYRNKIISDLVASISNYPMFADKYRKELNKWLKWKRF